jgi:glyoxylase-like metal-dependent hydrolase (beta-lactamase superfamily II)
MQLIGPIFETHVELMPGVPLCVYAVRGERFSVLIDTAVAGMKDQILELCHEVGRLEYVLITHAHADHIGCNAAVREATKARFVAGGALPWIEDLETHYREFCLPDKLPEADNQRAEIMGLMDGPVPVDFVITEGVRIRLGGSVELETFAFPGHKLEEIGFLEHSTGSLIIGDVLLALAAPFFHGFQTSTGFYRSLEKLEHLVGSGRVKRVLSAHHMPLEPEQALEAINHTRRFLDEVEAATLEAATGVDFETLWKTVCHGMNKQLEFRGYAMLEVQVAELVAAGRLVVENGRIRRSS